MKKIDIFLLIDNIIDKYDLLMRYIRKSKTCHEGKKNRLIDNKR